jgi:hypothetical protein
VQDAEAAEALGDLGGRHGCAIVAQAGTRQPALLKRLRQAMRDDLGRLGQIPLQMTGKLGAIIQHAEQDRGLPLAACGEHLPGAVVTIPVP